MLSETLEHATADGKSSGGEAVGAGLSAAVPGNGGGTISESVVEMPNPPAHNYEKKTWEVELPAMAEQATGIVPKGTVAALRKQIGRSFS